MAPGVDLIEHLSKSRVDLIVPVGYGLNSPEDGTIFALARHFNIPCAGPDPICGAVCTDKSLFGSVVTGLFTSVTLGEPPFRVRVPRTIVVSGSMSARPVREAVDMLPAPLLLKPAFGGSSIGIEVMRTPSEAVDRAVSLCKTMGRVLIQEFVCGREISSTIVDLPDGPYLCPIVEIDKENAEFFGFEEKFGDNAKSHHIIPADFPSGIIATINRVMLTLHSALGLCGVSRVDALINAEEAEIIILEANPIAGMLESSIATDAARACGIDFETLAVTYALTAFRGRDLPALK
jgi:D-alanine-D-alanine ligase